ncbi:MAG: 2,3-bisphosphoglycerate-independent phosphoglycerate mutase [Bacilli bacterium]|nr:2,3-bisphosphoglycerate-independent phosphoglycerate mutase [Bacilli bacterium]
MRPIVLCIMDGVGINKNSYGNAFLKAQTPNIDYLWNNFPHSKLIASGEDVGLPNGQMGNSEVGHMNIGAGRIVYQPLQLINQKIKDGSIYNNKAINDTINYVNNNHTKLHICGLISDGGVHSHINHLLSLIDIIKEKKVARVYFHLFLDGRDTLPSVAYKYIKILEDKIKDLPNYEIATLSGRYYAMDRDNRWDRIKKTYDAMTLGIGDIGHSPKEIIDINYKKGITDEFIMPAVLDKNGLVSDYDGMIVFNFRPDRLRELFSAFTNDKVNGFERKIIKDLKLTTMMHVSPEVTGDIAFEMQYLEDTLGEYISHNNIRQLRIAETEKYAHVTYFFDGGVEKKLSNCDRILIPSPKVATYDMKPEMSAYEITETLISKLEDNLYDLVILNYANGDMVGHTGDFNATVKAVETVDKCIGKLYQKLMEKEGTLVLTADHGNCEVMLDKDGNKVTTHTTNLVPFIITRKGIKLKDGRLSDIAPTLLALLNLNKPPLMTGKILIESEN